MKKLHVRITTLEGMLGTSPANDQTYSDFIGKNAPDAATLEEEIAALGVDAVAEKGRTIFPRLEDGTPFLYDYQIKGFFKDSCGMLSRLTGKDESGKRKKPVNESGKITAYKKTIDGLIFPQPRKIPIVFDGEMDDCQRPLRAQTAQGDRVALANSETVSLHSTFTFTINLLDKTLEPAIRECLDYAELHGFGQWRNSGKGTAWWEELDEHGNVIDGNLPAELKASA